MGQRLSRARAKIARAGIPFAIPGPEDWSARLNSVLTVIYLIFNEGYRTSSGDSLVRVDLCDEAIWLARLVSGLVDDRAEPLGLLSLMLTTHARRGARIDPQGMAVALGEQDRALWDRAMADEGLTLLDTALGCRRPGPFQIKAAISALHVQAVRAEATDWRQMVLLYDALLVHEPTPVVRLNRAVALHEAGTTAAARDEIDRLADNLGSYQPYHAARAEILGRSGQRAAARAAFETAIELSQNPAERALLARRRDRVTPA
ncbi:MAG: DUF6596 domain-containing protein [Paracoccaceae bacterium]